MTVAVALGIFSSIYASTDHRNALDRAAYRAGADVRVTYGSPAPRTDTLLAPLPGLAASSVAFRDTTSPGSPGAGTTVLGVDPGTFPAVAWWRPDLGASPSALVRTLAARDPDGLALPGRPQSLSVWAYGAGLAGHLLARLNDADGRTGTLDPGDLTTSAWRLLEAPLRLAGGAAPAYPVKVVSLVVRPAAGGAPVAVALSDLAAGGRVVEGFDQPDGWLAQDAGGVAVQPWATMAPIPAWPSAECRSVRIPLRPDKPSHHQA